MNKQKAKEVLIACRLGTTDVDDPEVREALSLAQSDPQLREWFEEQLRLQKEVRDAIRGISVPSGLRESILVAQHRAASPWRNRMKVLLPLAAALVLIATGILFMRQSGSEQRTWANFKSRMTSIALRQYSMDILSNDEQAVRKHFAARGTPSDFPLPPPMANLTVKGGLSTRWHNHPVSMLCFNWKDNETLYLFVIDQGVLSADEIGATPMFESYKSNLNTASWSADGKLYFLAAPIPRDELQRLVATATAGINSRPFHVFTPPRIPFDLHHEKTVRMLGPLRRTRSSIG